MIYHVFANRSNVGDWLSAQGIQSLLTPLTVKELLCDLPFLPETLGTLGQATERDFIIIGGGGLFMDYFMPFWQGFLPIAQRVPFVIWGVGACDVKLEQTLPPREVMEDILCRARLCVVRDELTRRHLGAGERVTVVPCPTFAAVKTATTPPQHRLLHVDSYDNVGGQTYESMLRTAEEFAALTERDYRQTNNLISAGSPVGLRKTLALYESADLVLTSRLHGCIIALAAGRRVLAVSGDRKMESFMEASCLAEWVLDRESVAALPYRLAELHRQMLPALFVEQARRENRKVASQVRELVRASHP